MASVTKGSSWRSCWRQVAITVSDVGHALLLDDGLDRGVDGGEGRAQLLLERHHTAQTKEQANAIAQERTALAVAAAGRSAGSRLTKAATCGPKALGGTSGGWAAVTNTTQRGQQTVCY